MISFSLYMARTCLWLCGPAMWQLFFLINLLNYQYANMPVMQAVFMCHMFEQRLMFTDLHAHCLSHASSYHFSVLVSWPLNKHPEEQMLTCQLLEQWNQLSNVDLFVWLPHFLQQGCTGRSSWLNMLSWTSCAFTLFICTFISIKINHKSVFNKKKRFIEND